MRRQKSVNAALISDIEVAVERDMLKFSVSRSFVIAVALAYHYGIDEQEDFHPRGRRK